MMWVVCFVFVGLGNDGKLCVFNVFCVFFFVMVVCFIVLNVWSWGFFC